MAQATEPEIVELAIVSCETCDNLFLFSGRRETCPGCGGPASVTLFEFVGDASGLHLKDGTLAALAGAPAPPPAEAVPAEPEAPAAVEEERVEGAPAVMNIEEMGLSCGYFIGGWESVSEEDLRGMLGDLGAEPEEAAAAVGRLVAVRDLLVKLEAPEPVEGEPPAAPDPAQAEGEQESEPSESS